MGGTVVKRVHPSGLVRWRAVLSLQPDPITGKRRQRRQDFTTKREAQACLAQWLVEQKHGTFVDRSDQTVRQMMEYWLRTYASTKSAKTFADYKYQVTKYILPHLGEAKVQQLHPEHVVEWHTILRTHFNGHGGTRTISVAHQRLKQALDQAVTLGLVSRNVAALVKPPQEDDRAKALHTWTEEEARTFLDVADEHGIYGPIWRVSLATGMRRGELLGLRWQDIVWDACILRVRQAVSMVKGTVIVGPPKTEFSIRDIPVTEDLMEVLQEHQARQNERRLATAVWRDHDLVFPSAVGTPVNPNNLLREYYQLLQRAGVPPIHIHDQRHTHASWAIREGIDPKTVAERLGHRDVLTTLDRYTHIDQETHRAAAQTLGRKVTRRRPSGKRGVDSKTRRLSSVN
jgi:integrase